MSQDEERDGPANTSDATAAEDPAWEASLLEVFREVINKLPDDTSLGELVRATREHPHIAPVLQVLSVQDLIDMALSRPLLVPELEEDASEEGPSVIRRRADVPNGDTLLLTLLADKGPASEVQLAKAASLTLEQVRLLMRQLAVKNLVHTEGSGNKRKVRITRAGHQTLRRSQQRREPKSD